VLAAQHLRTMQKLLGPLAQGGMLGGSDIATQVTLITGSQNAASRKEALALAASGAAGIVIGTHALLGESVAFKDLGLIVVDEQHRFGVEQRDALKSKATNPPHLLVMTATPIPRTLALSIYGDLDLSLLDQMPLGRKPIITEVVGPEKRENAYQRVRSELALGHQAYVICPRIDEPDPQKEFAVQAKSVKAEAERLKLNVFPDASIDILHSKMTPKAKEEVMKRFEDGKIDILVATSVVEVGVNVPNATVILIEGAERFGLAQLHQLRGRVIRSSNQAYCFALPNSYGPATKERLKALTTAKNGFELAEYDLALRGSGELYGARQWGVSDIAMEALKNIKMVEAARNEAQKLVHEDPTLAKHPLLATLAKEADEEVHPE
ncbi:MAG: helicase-related protein, partial [Undibacterium sp.]